MLKSNTERPIRGTVGNYAEGNKFFGRDTEVAELIELIKSNQSTIISAPRRIGKTSVMHEVESRLNETNDYLCLFIDVEAAREPADVIKELGKSIEKQRSSINKSLTSMKNQAQNIAGKLNSLKKVEVGLNKIGIEFTESTLNADWKDKGETILSTLADNKNKTVIFVDELPILLAKMLELNNGKIAKTGLENAKLLFNWFRKQSQEHQNSITFIFAGSISLNPLLRRMGETGATNNFYSYHLEVWSETVARSCLNSLAKGENKEMPKDVNAFILRTLRWYSPYHIQLYFYEMHKHCRKTHEEQYSIPAAETVFNNIISCKDYAKLEHMKERLRHSMPEGEYELAMQLLWQTAMKGRLSKQAAKKLINKSDIKEATALQILGQLEYDQYLERTDTGEHIFVSNLLEQWLKIDNDALFFECIEE